MCAYSCLLLFLLAFARLNKNKRLEKLVSNFVICLHIFALDIWIVSSCPHFEVYGLVGILILFIWQVRCCFVVKMCMYGVRRPKSIQKYALCVNFTFEIQLVYVCLLRVRGMWTRIICKRQEACRVYDKHGRLVRWSLRRLF